MLRPRRGLPLPPTAMTSPEPSFRPPRAVWVAFWTLAALMAASLAVVVLRVDLSPQVEPDFFFSTEDPALQASQRIEALFPSRPQLVIAAVGMGLDGPAYRDPGYVEQIRGLTAELAAIPGVARVQSLTSGPASPATVADSPLWRRLLLAADPAATHLVALVDADGGAGLIARVEAVLARHRDSKLRLEVSGVPYVVELIRRHLLRDLRVFSSAAIAVFGLVILFVYRSWPLVVGTLLACVGACLATLTALYLLGTPIGLLTANIATIVFVLTLSHTVFLTANWRRLREGMEPEAAVARAVRITFTASVWCMVAALSGFGSLLLASAKPLRQLGVSGLVGTVTAIVVAYGFYPAFLRWGRPAAATPLSRRLAAAKLPGPWATTAAAILCLAAAFGLGRLDTDPSLLAYFAPGGELRSGLALIDRNGGSSPLEIVVSDPGGRRLDAPEAQAALEAFQEGLEKEPAVGMALSLPVLLAEARRVPFVAFLPPDKIVDVLAGDNYGRIARSFLNEDRTQAMYFLRMREAGRAEAREAVVRRLIGLAAEAGLRVELVGGLYDLQGKLGQLVRASLGRELGGLLAFFVLVAAAVTRRARAAAAMVGCLGAVPLLLLGAVGWLGQPVDVIAAPGANVAISLGIDAMIHLAMAVRRRRRAGDGEAAAWANALGQQRPAIVGAMSILAAGFGIFVLSSFPPTRRFGLLVAAGSLLSAAMALRVLPWLAAAGRRRAAAAAASS
jgi:uncharacterized protein